MIAELKGKKEERNVKVLVIVICRCQRSSECPMCLQSVSLKDPTRLVSLVNAFDIFFVILCSITFLSHVHIGAVKNCLRL